ncbi:MAG: glycogen debranching N-terminal domain-containing protein [Alphaproteobacteria bacterium]
MAKPQTFVLKHNDSFAVLDAAGDMLARNEKDHDIADGLITRDTRILSTCILKIDGVKPALQESLLENNNVVFHARLKQGAVAIERVMFVYHDSLYEGISLRNDSGRALQTVLSFDLDADFRDMFELRGAVRPSRGETLPQQRGDNSITFSYKGLDNVTRQTAVVFSEEVREGGIAFALQAGETRSLYVRAGAGAAPVTAAEFEAMRKACTGYVQQHVSRRPQFSSSNAQFDKWIRANAVDIALLTTETSDGPYPYAGIPWYSCPFGRDGIITAFELLWQDPALARGVLALLARHQALEESKFHDSAPGKIMHEIRYGEMAALREIPHTPYYGTADATPLFISLAGAYFARTGDVAFIKTLWPHVMRALEWIDTYGDRDGDGYVEYQRGAESGLGNQGWKDSVDAISHADGRLAPGPIALCEVQGYVYAGKRDAAVMAKALGYHDRAQNLEKQAAALKEKFNRDFWWEEAGTYALALDGDKKPCHVLSSNAGHLLFSGIVPEDRAKRVGAALMSPAMFSGWGVRTLGSGEKRYEPVKPPEGYHNGTVWVHDTALCAAGMAKYGMSEASARLMQALFDAAQHLPGLRLPELFGGLPREAGQPPARYPVACSPQAWASASESLLLQAMLGITVDGIGKALHVRQPRLPAFLDELTVSGLKIGEGAVTLRFYKENDETVVEAPERSNGITVVLE